MRLARACPVLFVAMWLLAACGLSGPSEPKPSRPPSDQAFEIIEAKVQDLPGVESTALQLYDDIMTDRSIDGAVYLSPEADPVEVMDDVYRTLWTFRSWPPTLSVTGYIGEQKFGPDGPLGKKDRVSLITEEMEERYGPWPGSGPTP